MSSEEQARFLRPKDGRLIGGVCAALSRGLEADVTLVRGALFVLGLLVLPLFVWPGGALGALLGLVPAILYFTGWILIAEE